MFGTRLFTDTQTRITLTARKNIYDIDHAMIHVVFFCHVHITVLLTKVLHRQQERKERKKIEKHVITDSVYVRNYAYMCRSKNPLGI